MDRRHYGSRQKIHEAGRLLTVPVIAGRYCADYAIEPAEASPETR